MKGSMKCLVLLLVLVTLAGTAVSCSGPAPTAAPAPTSAPAAPPTAAPTAAPAAAPTTAPTTTTAPATAPTAAPTAAPAKAKAEAPEDGMPRISLEELKSLVDSGASIAILDVRAKESYEMGHIKGAVSFPWKPEMTASDVEMLPIGNPIITYCDCGPGEHDSAGVAKQLKELGAEAEIKVLSDPSIEGWIAAGYPTE